MPKAHEELKKLLGKRPGKAFALGVTRKIYEWADRIPDEAIRYRIFEEMTIRYETGEKTRLGLDRQDHYRIDALLFIQPGYRALNQSQCFTVGIELKSSKADLMGDMKMAKYMGWTDLLFIGVPADLAEDAIKKAEEVSLQVFGESTIEGKSMVGVFNVENGHICKMPARKQSVSMENRLKIQEQVIYNVLFDELKTIKVKLDDIELTELPVATLSAATLPGADIPSVSMSPSGTQSALPSETPSEAAETSPDGSERAQTANATTDEAIGGTGARSANSEHAALDEEFVVARNEKRAENRARREMLAKNLPKRNRQLTDKTRDLLAGLTDRDQLVFWVIRDATEYGGINGVDIPTTIGQSPAGVNRSVKKLKERGLITLDGSPKIGKFQVIGDALKSSRCVTCRLNEECAGTALHCGSYQSIDSDK